MFDFPFTDSTAERRNQGLGIQKESDANRHKMTGD